MGRVLPILFNTDMVRAILDGRKTVTRRVVKPRYQGFECDFQVVVNEKTEKRRIDTVDEEGLACRIGINPPYNPGDILYVRETWSYDVGGIYIYKASYEENFTGNKGINAIGNKIKWHPSIHMPKEAARIWLKVTDVRVERLQDIDGLGAYSEGANAEVPPILNGLKFPDGFEDWSEDEKDKWFENAGRRTYMAKLELANRLITDFKKIWNATISTKDLNKYSWNANPWVWVIEFEQCEKPEENESI